METPQENSSLNPPESAATSKNPKRVEAGRRATATRKAAREEDAKILEQLQASKMELQQPPDNTDSKMDLTLWIVGGVGILVVAWYGYSQHSAGKWSLQDRHHSSLHRAMLRHSGLLTFFTWPSSVIAQHC